MRLSAMIAGTCALVAYGSFAYAGDPPKDAAKAGGGDAAAAQALFYEARQLMKENKFGLACPKLEESLRMDYGVGTEFNLADCYEKVGKLATAWSGYLSVASAAHNAKQLDREKVARERAKALEPRLPKLTIEVPSGAPASIDVKRDGVNVGQAAWGTAVPVDPGSHEVTATATGKLPWKGSVAVAEGKSAKITVPPMQDAPVAAVAAAPIMKPATTTSTGQSTEAVSTTMTTSFPEPIVESRGQTQRTVGWIAAGLGIASLGVGAGFGINSLAQHSQAKDHCTGNICDQSGVNDRNSAMKSGNISTITTIAGGGALLGGLILVLTAPKNPSREKSVTGSIRAVPQVATTGGGLSLEGIIP